MGLLQWLLKRSRIGLGEGIRNFKSALKSGEEEKNESDAEKKDKKA
jgi:Sec-independent protein translocase protein TatA